MRQMSMFDQERRQSLQEPAPRPLPKPEELFPKAAIEIPCEDRWPPFRFVPAVMTAYKAAEDEGLIRIDSVQISQSTASATVYFRSAVPIEWARERLKELMPG